jgi:outer membrane receptor protein involved in Fe transport
MGSERETAFPGIIPLNRSSAKLSSTFHLAWLLACLALAFMAQTGLAQGAGEGTVSGTVLSTWDGTPLPSVVVSVRGTTLATQTDASGRFELKPVPAGEHMLIFSKPGYNRVSVEEVRVLMGQSSRADVRLNPEFYELDTYEVVADLVEDQSLQILSDRQDSASLVDAIGSETFAKYASSDAADIVTKVSGTSVVDGKYAVIRGLSDRYTSSTLNGGEIPSPDPYRKAVQLDMFPSSMINKVEVSKTFTPDQPGGFTGGAINIVTKSFPEEFKATVSAGVGANSQVIGNDEVLGYDGGSTDFLGFDDGTRAIPEQIESADPSEIFYPQTSQPQFRNEADAQAYEELLKSFESTQLGPEEKTGQPNLNFGASAGGSAKLFNRPLGLAGSLSYDLKHTHYDGLYQRWSPRPGTEALALDRNLDDTRSAEEVSWGAAATLGYQVFPDHRLGVNYIYSQSSEDVARRRVGQVKPEQIDGSQPSTAYLNTLSFTERNIAALQFLGDHVVPDLNGLSVNWLVSVVGTAQEEPDLRLFNFNSFPTGQPEFGGSSGVPEPGFPTRYYRDLQEDNRTFKGDVKLPLEPDEPDSNYLKLGGLAAKSEREFVEKTYSYGAANLVSGDPETYPNEFLTGTNLDYYYVPAARPGQSGNYRFSRWLTSDIGNNLYNGEQTITGLYGMADAQPLSWLRLLGGARYETTDLSVDSTSRGNTDVTTATIEEQDWLPAAGLVFTVITNMNVRLHYSKTLARPTFREFAAYRSYDVTTDELLQGNPNLQTSHIQNYDLRWEWFRRPGELLSASVFYKDIDAPIEKQALDRTGDIVTYTNYPQAKLFGVEVEARSSLDVIAGALRNFSLGANLAWIESEVTNPENLEKTKVQPTRPLFDQSPYIIGADLTYDNRALGTTVSLAFYQAGERLYLVNPTGYDVYEQPAPQLDLVISQRFAKHWKARFYAKNLLNPEFDRIYGQAGELDREYLYSSYTKGITFNLTLSYEF